MRMGQWVILLHSFRSIRESLSTPIFLIFVRYLGVPFNLRCAICSPLPTINRLWYIYRTIFESLGYGRNMIQQLKYGHMWFIPWETFLWRPTLELYTVIEMYPKALWHLTYCLVSAGPLYWRSMAWHNPFNSEAISHPRQTKLLRFRSMLKTTK